MGAEITGNPLSDQRDLRGRNATLILLMAAYGCSLADRMIVGIVSPQLKAEFEFSDTELGMLGGLAFAVFYATLGLPLAHLADRFSRKWIIIASLLLFSLMTAFCGLAGGFVSLLLLRMLVGIGEAGVNPASQSIVADFFSERRRPVAMSIMAMGANIGIIFGFIAGGIASQVFGWRMTFLIVGLPGILVAGLAVLALREPARGMSDKASLSDAPNRTTVLDAARYLRATPKLRHLFAACTLTGMLSYGMTQWMPTFFRRSHDLDMVTTGMILAGFFGVLGAIGTLLGGLMVQKANAHQRGLGLKLIGVTQLAAIPLAVAAYLASELWVALAIFVPLITFSSFYLGPTFSLVQTHSPPEMRAKMAALLMLSVNLIGFGLGPLLIGALSDFLTVTSGQNALRHAMAISTSLSAWAAYHFWRASYSRKAPGSMPGTTLVPNG